MCIHMQAGRRALELAKDDATFEALKAGGATMSDMTQQVTYTLLLLPSSSSSSSSSLRMRLLHLCALVFFPVARGGILATRVCAIHHCTCICIERKREREREREKEIERVVEVHLYIYTHTHTHTHTHMRGG